MLEYGQSRKGYPSDLTDEQWAYRGTDAPARQAEHTRRSPAHGRPEGSPQHDSLSEPEWLPMGYAATRFAAQEYRL